MNQILLDVFRFLHFAGLAALLGGLLVQLRVAVREVSPVVLIGAIAQLVTGLALLLLTLADANHLKVTVKLAVLLVACALLLVRRRRGLEPIHYVVVLGLTIADLGLAVFW